ncbi:MAG TPA: sulfur carrier protein ThiS [Candidatus Binatia bacterium]|nr:sulfur carrier protein ThiS [Candidatus Binatia bacterium]
MRLSVNGEEREIEAGATIEKLLGDLGLRARRVAVEVNREVVLRDAWPRTELHERDHVEIVQFVGGG